MSTRLNFAKEAPGAYRAMLGLSAYGNNHTTLEPALQQLVKILASQLNRCAFCIDVHWQEARLAGETERRLYGLTTWEAWPDYSPRERAALAWTKTVTCLGDDLVSDAEYAAVQSQFNEKELVDLTLAIVAINGWNRLNVAFRTAPGTELTAV
jgi:AhpD family alkylhydroperoxidase